jgi:hypothetical protein
MKGIYGIGLLSSEWRMNGESLVWIGPELEVSVFSVPVGASQVGNCARCGIPLKVGSPFFDLRLSDSWREKLVVRLPNLAPRLWFCNRDHLVQYLQTQAVNGRESGQRTSESDFCDHLVARFKGNGGLSENP